jgi:hypothetical protein
MKAKKIIESEKLNTTRERSKVKFIREATVSVKIEKKRKLVSNILVFKFKIAKKNANRPKQTIKIW